MPQLTTGQLARARALLHRLQHLEDAAVTNTWNSMNALSPSDLFLRRAKALEARVFRLELTGIFGEAFKEVDELESRLGLLERGVTRLNSPALSSSSSVRRVAQALSARGLESNVTFLRVPDAVQYYEGMNLAERAVLLGSPSPAHLCKSLLFSTSGGRTDESQEESVEEGALHDESEQFVLLVVPYDSKVDASKLRSALKANNLLQSRKSSPCLASPGRAERVLGFPHNGVSVVGGSSEMANRIPIVIAEVLTKLQPPCIYLGGGEPDVKLFVNDVHQLVRATNALVLDVTERRSSDDILASPSLANSSEPQLKNISTTSRNKRRAPDGESHGDGSDGDNQPPSKKPPSAEFDDLDVRVGMIQSARRHPNSAKLMCEMVDIGESTGPRPVVSGIQEWYTPEQLVGQRVCIVANLKAATLGGEKSDGMVLCASWKEDSKIFVRIVEPPAEAVIGARITVDASPKQPATAAVVKKKKIFEAVAETLCLGLDGHTVMWSGRTVGTSQEGSSIPCKVTGGKAGAKVS